MKTMKFFFVLLALLASFALVACSDDDQDVNVESDVSTHTYTQYYTVAGSRTYTTETIPLGTSTSSYSKKVSTHVYTPNIKISSKVYTSASISWTENPYTNRTTYTINIPTKRTNTTYTSATDTTGTPGTPYANLLSLSINKVGSKYYVDQVKSVDENGLDVYTPIEIEVNPKSDTVTISFTETETYYYYYDSSAGKTVYTTTEVANGTKNVTTEVWNYTLTKIQ